MAGLLVPVVWILASVAMYSGRNRLGFGPTIRDAMVAAAIVCSIGVVVTLELLSLIQGVAPGSIRACWFGAAGVLAGIVWRQRDGLRRADGVVPRLEPASWGPALVCGGVGIFTGVCAALIPATNIDGLLYHQPRQLQWLQAGSIDHFPTQDYRLTVNPPFAEYCGFTLELLTGRDHAVNLPQWAAFIGAMITVSLIARELGASQYGQWLAAALTATLPIAVQQAASPKNDITAAFWLAVVGYATVRAWSARPLAPGALLLSGCALGLLALTKGTGLVFAVPAVLLYALGLWRRRPECSRWVVGLAGLLAALVPLGHWVRNLSVYGSLSGQTFGLPVEAAHPLSLVSNLMRNLAAQAALPWQAWNEQVLATVAWLHSGLGLSWNDPLTTWQPTLPFQSVYDVTLWENATAPIHWLLAGVTLGLLPLLAQGPQARPRIVATISAVGALLAFSWVFKWQPSNARLLLPVEVVLTPPAAVVLAGARWRGWGWAVVILAAALLIPLFAKNAAELPGVGRPWRERWSPEARYGCYADAARLGRLTAGRIQMLKPRSVGMVNNAMCGWEYPIARTVREWLTPPPRISYFYPTPEMPDLTPPPDIVLDFSGDAAPPLIRHPSSDQHYHISDRIGPFTLYRPIPPDFDFTLTNAIEPVAVARFGVRIDCVPPLTPERKRP